MFANFLAIRLFSGGVFLISIMEWLSAFSLATNYKITSLLLYGLITLFVCYISYLFLKRQRKVWIINRIPGPKTVPIFGNALELNVDPKDFLELYFKKFCKFGNGIIRIWIGPIAAISVYNAEGAEVILRSQKFIKKSPEYKLAATWLGDGLLLSTGEKWFHRRRLLTPSFHFKILEDFIDVFNVQSSKFIKKLESLTDGKHFDIFPLISLCTMDIIIETAMGTSINAQDEPSSDYVKAVKEAGELMMLRFRVPWLRPDFLFNLSNYGKKYNQCLSVMHNLSASTIRERRRDYIKHKSSNEKNKEEETFGQKKRLAFLDMLLEHSEGENALSEEDIREEVDTFMFEGQDTTAAGMNWSIFLLGNYPECQNKVFEELDGIFGTSDRPATPADLREMKYLECCIKETLRLFPSAPLVGRILDEDVDINGYTIPKGTGINILMYSMHRDPVHFPNPEEFNPERFFTENCAKRHPYAYIPFSAGPRNCIGQRFALMEEKVVLSSFFRKYRVESLLKYEEMNVLADMILRPKDGTFVKLSSRK